MNVVHELDGVKVSPIGWEQTEIEKDFLAKSSEVSVSLTQLEFRGKEGKDLRGRVLSGLSGGVGVTEGVPYVISVDSVRLDCYIDFMEGFELLGNDGIIVSIKKRYSGDWLKSKADAFTFRYLHSIGILKDSDFIKVPYVINYVPDGVEVSLLALSIYVTFKEVYESTLRVGQALARVINAFTPVTGISVGAGAGVVTAMDLGDIITLAINTALDLAYSLAMATALKDYITELKEQLVSEKRFHKVVRIGVLFQRACDYLGLTLKSDLIAENYNLAFLPPKDHKGGEAPEGYKGTFVELGIDRNGGVINTFGDLIREFKKYFRADFRIIDNQFIFEKESDLNKLSGYKIPSVFIDQSELENKYKPDVSRITSSYLIEFTTDLQDRNTLDNTQGLVFEAQTEQKTIVNADLSNLGRGVNIRIPFALGKRKDGLSNIEEIFLSLGKLVDSITKVLGVPTSFKDSLESRVGALNLSNHFFSVPKLIWLSGDNLAQNQTDNVSALNLWNKYHVQFGAVQDQRYFVESHKVNFCEKDLLTLLNSNVVYTDEAEEAEIEKLSFNPYERTAVLTYNFKKRFTNNLTYKFIV